MRESKYHRRGQRSGFRVRIPFLSRADRLTSVSFERGLNHLEHERIRFSRIQRRIFHRLKLDAAEKKSGHSGADARQNRPALWKFDVDLVDAERPSLILQSRNERREGSAL